MLSAKTSTADPLALALADKARRGERGGAAESIVAAGDGWRVADIVCTAGPHDHPFEERHASTSISLVLAGTFTYRGDRGKVLLSSGALLLVNADRGFECSHQHGEGDRCLSFQFDRETFAHLAHDAGASRPSFTHDRLPPLRELAPLVARTALAAARGDSYEEVALELAAAAVQLAADARPIGPAVSRDTRRVARVLRVMEHEGSGPLGLDELAHLAGMSRYHFLRTFKSVTGVTPHQWLLRSRLRDAAQRLATSTAPVTQIALDVGFDDLSNFIRTFRAEFGVSPRRYRVSV